MSDFDNNLIQVANKAQIEVVLPFKPFTLDEVRDVTECSSKLLDHLVKEALPLKNGEGVSGLDLMQAFAVFVGMRYLEEGADMGRTLPVVKYVGSMDHRTLMVNLDAGNSFPVPGELGLGIACMVPPPKGRLGQKLDLRRLYSEFRHNLDKRFPPNKS